MQTNKLGCTGCDTSKNNFYSQIKTTQKRKLIFLRFLITSYKVEPHVMIQRNAGSLACRNWIQWYNNRFKYRGYCCVCVCVCGVFFLLMESCTVRFTVSVCRSAAVNSSVVRTFMYRNVPLSGIVLMESCTARFTVWVYRSVVVNSSWWMVRFPVA